jgi:hypothetical protein
MEWWFGFAVIGMMILLRLALPALTMAAFIAALHRLNARWETTA